MKTVHVLGDSIALQYGPYLERQLAGVMICARAGDAALAAANLDIPQGANGGDSGMVLTRLRALAAPGALAADLMLLNCGLHDIKTDPLTGDRQVPLPQYRANLAAIVALLADLSPQLVWLRSTPVDDAIHNARQRQFHRHADDLTAYNQAADEIMAAHGVPVIDLFTFTANLGPDLYCDHVHFHEHIRAQQAAFIAGWLTAQP